jgi:uncharacterized membrane protein (DUF373 family)
MIEKQLNRVVFALEIAVSIALVAIAALLVVALALEIASVVTDGLQFGRDEFTRVISTALEIFIVIELFRIAIAYTAHRNVVPVVLEASLVAVARKFVVFEPKGDYLESALGMAALLVAVGISWWLLKQSNACELDGEH